VCLSSDCASETDGDQAQGELQLIKAAAGDGDGMLLVADLVDTDKTAKYLR
jgi:adenine/guanine phosphoribosyltransferase-like PRPP-binding protein